LVLGPSTGPDKASNLVLVLTSNIGGRIVDSHGNRREPPAMVTASQWLARTWSDRLWSDGR